MQLACVPRVRSWSVFMIGLLSAGCGGGAPDPAAESNAGGGQLAQAARGSAVQGYDCESLLTGNEIDEITGLSGAARTSGTRGDQNDILLGHTECGYQLPEDFTLGVAVYTGRGDGEALETFDAVWNLAQNQGAETVAGIGDGALLQTNLSAGPRLLVRAKGRGVIVSAGDPQGLGKLDLQDVVRRVATIIVGRL
jgi:hypothetical protein